MNKFQLRNQDGKVTNKYFGILVFLVGILVYLIIPLKLNDKLFEYSLEPEEDEVIFKKLEFDGELVSENIFDDTYMSAIYKKDDKYVPHLVDLKEGKEITYQDMIKKDQKNAFNNKIRDLLLLKYPKFIVDELLKTKNTYFFEGSKLHIVYDKPSKIETTRNFDLYADYNEIKDYIICDLPLSETYENESGFTYDPNKVSVSFTFDDGPNKEKTIKLLDALEDYKMTATFFIVANKIQNDASTVKALHDSHSEIGYHTYAHSYLTKQKTSEIQEEFIKSNELLNKVTGETFKLTRPPYGAFNEEVLKSIDNVFVRWNLDTNDWRYRDVDYIYDYVIDNLEDGSIILFHDSYDTSVEAATKLMKELYLKDIQVVSVSELAQLKGKTLNNHEVYFDFK